MSPKQSRPWILVFATIVAIVALVALALPNLNNYLVSDEIDYAKAIDQGIYENWWESRGLAAIPFFQETLSAFFNNQDLKVWHRMMQNEDVLALRHFHGPFSYLCFALAKSINSSEIALRSTTLFFASLLLICFGFVIYKLNHRAHPIIAGAVIINCALYLVLSFQALAVTPHLFYGLCAFIALSCAAGAVKINSNKLAIASSVAAGICATTLEYTPVLVLVLILSALAKKQYKLIVFGIGAFIITTTVFWPAGVLKLKLAMTYTKYTYAALFSGYYGSISDSLLLRNMAILSFCLTLFIGSLIATYACWKNRSERWLLVFIGYAWVMIGLNLSNHFIYQQYILSIVPALVIPAVFGLSLVWNQGKFIPRVLISFLLIICSTSVVLKVTKTVHSEKSDNLLRGLGISAAADQLRGVNNVLYIGFNNYLAKRYLGSHLDIASLDSDIASLKALETFVVQGDYEAVVIMSNAPRVLTKLELSEVEQIINSHFKKTLINPDFSIFLREKTFPHSRLRSYLQGHSLTEQSEAT